MNVEHCVTVIVVLGGVGGMVLVVRPLVDDVRELIAELRKGER